MTFEASIIDVILVVGMGVMFLISCIQNAKLENRVTKLEEKKK